MSDHQFNPDFCQEDVHQFFSLSYASYLALPRSIMQSMPADWQHRFSELMDEVQDKYGGYDMRYTVNKRDAKGRFIPDELRNYERGRRIIEPRPFQWKSAEEDES